ncbi:hypothetical protein C5Y96_18920 [Blastopirellula marina]|uniref:Uncharacterized protein n=1 Tax=Blastopirellula marina TaxID=124 RepID=A0A2S8F623_9BACT|nr:MULTISPECIES: hypothetical protein [Pirellulaceae]PQO27601.1 hypothetical protein C5Y96_18920 [Blastopirellula marina]RCS48138.1 hypothetical protein DTL36_18945 [Bremerella cremea]
MSSGFLSFVKECLTNMAPENISLSRVNYGELRYLEAKMPTLENQKIQERPLAYEFYHQARCRWGNETWPEGKKFVIQAEVNKCYQDIRNLNKCPDFLIHRKTSKMGANFAVLEFKMTTNPLRSIREDIEKLASFGDILGYKFLIEVLVGNSRAVKSHCTRARKHFGLRPDVHPQTVLVLGFDPQQREIVHEESISVSLQSV